MNTNIVTVAELNDEALDVVAGGGALKEIVKYFAWDIGIGAAIEAGKAVGEAVGNAWEAAKSLAENSGRGAAGPY
jgi:hypothetical protein